MVLLESDFQKCTAMDAAWSLLPDFIKLEPRVSLVQHALEVFLSSFTRVVEHHHLHIDISNKSLIQPTELARGRYYGVGDEYPRSVFQGRYECFEDEDSLFIRPVVQDVPKVICSSVLDGVRLKHVVLLKGNPRF